MFFRRFAHPLDHIDNYFVVQQWWIRLVGIAMPETRRDRILYFMYKTFIMCIIFQIACLFSVTVYLDIRSGSFKAVAYSLPQMVIMYIATFYLAYFQFNAGKYFRLMAYMNKQFHFRSAKGLTYVSAQWTFEICNLTTTYYQILALISTAIVSLLPMFQTRRVLPLNCWYPFDFTVSPYYELLYASQVMVQVIMPLSFCVTMTLPLSMAFLLCGQYDMLCCELRNLPWTAVRYSSPGVDTVYKLRVMQTKFPLGESYNYSKEYLDNITVEKHVRVVPRKQTAANEAYNTEMQNQVHEVLCDCIRFHQVLNECCDLMEEVNNPYALIKILEISFQICVLALAILKSSESLLGNMASVLYLGLTVSDLFCLCYMGQIVETQALRIRDFLYDTPWERFGAPYRRTMLIMLMYTQKPKVMTGGKFFALSYETFVATVKLSFSYFTLMESMGEE